MQLNWIEQQKCPSHTEPLAGGGIATEIMRLSRTFLCYHGRMSEMDAMRDWLGEMFAQVGERFDRIDERIDRFEQRVDERFERVNERFDRLEQRVDEIAAVNGTLIDEVAAINCRLG